MMIPVRLICIFVMMILVGCDQASIMKKMVPPEDEAVAKGYIDLLRQKKFAEIEKDIDPSIKTPDIHSMTMKMAGLIPAQTPDSIKVVGAHIFNGPNFTRTNITFEYQFQRNWFLINVATQKSGGATTIVGFNVNPIKDSLEQLNKFTLIGKSPLQYSVLVMAIIIPLFVLYALVLCIRTNIEKRKWLWVIFVILGLCQFSVDWTTGLWRIAPLYVQLFGAGAIAPAYGAWVISISLPLGAIIFLLKRKGIAKQQNKVENTDELVQAGPKKEEWLG